MPRELRIDMEGLRYGRLVGVAYSYTSSGGRASWHFDCDCGGTVIADGCNVRAGNTASCGCLHREICAERLTIHGHRAAKRHGPTYRSWQLLNDSARNPASPGWAAIGALGLSPCSEWTTSFEQFLSDMGERPDGTSLIRVDPSRGFEPGNCRWSPINDRSARALRGWARRKAATSAPVARSTIKSATHSETRPTL